MKHLKKTVRLFQRRNKYLRKKIYKITEFKNMLI